VKLADEAVLAEYREGIERSNIRRKTARRRKPYKRRSVAAARPADAAKNSAEE